MLNLRKLAAAFTLLAATTHAQQAPQPLPTPDDPTPVLKIESRLVSVSAIVHDKAGNPVSSLTRDSLILKEDGKPQPIAYFSLASDLPLTLALLVDTSGSQRAFIPDEIAAGRAFFPAMLTHPEDRAVLIQFDNNILQLAKLTSSVTTLEHALAYLQQSHADIPGNSASAGTLLYDSIIAVSSLELSSQRGRRAMVLLTDGDDNGSRHSLHQAIDAAQRADVMIYSVNYSNGYPGNGTEALSDLSKATGGRVFNVTRSTPLTDIYAQIAADLRLEYQLGYRPPTSKPGKYHHIQLTAVDKNLIVQTREGYFTPDVPKPLKSNTSK